AAFLRLDVRSSGLSAFYRPVPIRPGQRAVLVILNLEEGSDLRPPCGVARAWGVGSAWRNWHKAHPGLVAPAGLFARGLVGAKRRRVGSNAHGQGTGAREAAECPCGTSTRFMMASRWSANRRAMRPPLW